METIATPSLYMGDRVAWLDGKLIVTDDELLAKVDRPYLSASTSKSMHSCPARMVSDRAVPSGFDLFGATEKGSAAHTVLERMYQLPPGRRDAQHAMAILTEMSKEEPQFDGDVDYAKMLGSDQVRYNQWIAAIDASYRGVFTIEAPRDVDVHSTELRLDGVEVAGVPFKGFIDRIDHLKRGGLGVVDYKGLALDTPIPTPTGWTTMGALKVGDQVLGTAGLPVNVTVKSQVHNRPCYRLTFSDHSSVVCDNVHLWTVSESKQGRLSTSTLGADELFSRFEALAVEGTPRSLSIANAAPLNLPVASTLPIDPWLLGAWLGDGKTDGASFTVGKQDADDMLTLLKQHWVGRVTVEPRSLASASLPLTVSMSAPEPDQCGMGHGSERMIRRTYVGRRDTIACAECSRLHSAATHAGVAWGVKRNPDRWNVSLRTVLSDAGFLGNKHVPVEYLRGSRDQRLALLQGLMDTDGYWNPTRIRAVLVTTRKQIADAAAELVVSLGVTPQLHARPYVNAVRPDATAYTIEFTPVGFNPFLLPRKAVQVDQFLRENHSRPRALRRVIVSMVEVESVPTQCIQVDAPDSLYLCGPLMVPTHNTGRDLAKPNPRFDDAHGDQIRLYVEGVRVMTGEKPKAGHLLYISHGTSRRVNISDADIAKTKRGFAASWDALRTAVDARNFGTKVSPLCGWCPLVNSCPTGRDAGKTDKKGGAPSAVDLGIPSLRRDGKSIPLVGHAAKWADPAAVAGSVPEPVHAAHLSSGEEPPRNTDEGANGMTDNSRPWKEAKPYEGSDIDGHLSLNSYAATAVFGLSSLAAEQLAKHGQRVGPASVKALTALLASVVLDAQDTVTNGVHDWQYGANTRLRGVLRTSLDIIPLPFGEDEEAWAKWVKRTNGFIVAVAATAIDLYDNGPVVDLAALASMAPAAAAA